MTETVIRVEHLTKRFRLYGNQRTGPLKAVLFPKLHAKIPSFLAVNDVSFEVREGEVVGMLGHNGSGKTTLLKMIAGLLAADEGKISVRGKITALLALGVGVHPEFTGRENIIYGAMLLGMSKREVMRKLDSIIEFAEVGEHIDQPLRTYSSGMQSRLLFSTAMSAEPDILIVDEALATGDSRFVEKCKQRIRDVCHGGATVLFVSHSLQEVATLCDRCLLLNHGQLVFDGKPEESIHKYVALLHSENGMTNTLATMAGMLGFQMLAGTGEIRVLDGFFRDSAGQTSTLLIGETYQLVLELEADRACAPVECRIEIHSLRMMTTFGFIPPISPANEASPNFFSVPQGRSRLVIDLAEWHGGEGDYACDVQLFPADTANPGVPQNTVYCQYLRPLRFHSRYAVPRRINAESLVDLPAVRCRVETA